MIALIVVHKTQKGQENLVKHKQQDNHTPETDTYLQGID
jgi:hypothetical protein